MANPLPEIDEGDRYLTTNEAAELLGKTTAALNSMRARREGPKHYKTGRGVRYLLSELVAWMDRYAISPKHQPGHITGRKHRLECDLERANERAEEYLRRALIAEAKLLELGEAAA
jgi:predicted DNA-binding transcriptional regulator AlpA